MCWETELDIVSGHLLETVGPPSLRSSSVRLWTLRETSILFCERHESEIGVRLHTIHCCATCYFDDYSVGTIFVSSKRLLCIVITFEGENLPERKSPRQPFDKVYQTNLTRVGKHDRGRDNTARKRQSDPCQFWRERAGVFLIQGGHTRSNASPVIVIGRSGR